MINKFLTREEDFIQFLKDEQVKIKNNIESLQKYLISVNGKLIENDICPKCFSILEETEDDMFGLKIKYNSCMECGSRFMI
jgi:ferredoxin-like protein FixX